VPLQSSLSFIIYCELFLRALSFSHTLLALVRIDHGASSNAAERLWTVARILSYFTFLVLILTCLIQTSLRAVQSVHTQEQDSHNWRAGWSVLTFDGAVDSGTFACIASLDLAYHVWRGRQL
jgi:hypothetical protein